MQRKIYIFSLLLGSFFILFNSCEKHSDQSKEANQQTVIEGKSIKSSFQANDFVQLLKSVNPGLKTPIVSEVHFYPDGKFDILYLENDKRYSAAIAIDAEKAEVTTLTCGGMCSDEPCDALRTTKTSEGWVTQCEGCQACKLIITTGKVDTQIIARLTSVKTTLTNIAQASFKGTFPKLATASRNTNFAVTVTAITFDYFEGGTFALVSYADANNNQSTYGLLDDGNEITTIDCQGSCDCKEQYIHSTGVTQCSCNPCKMTVTKESIK